MSVENLADTAVENAEVPPSEDEQLGALFDEITRDSGPARGEDGKFKSANQAEVTDKPAEQNEDADASEQSSLEGEGEGEGGEDADSTPEESAVPPPANWVGSDGKIRPDLEAVWRKLSPEDQQLLSKQQTELHSRMSEQGRQLSAARPLHEVIERNKDLFANRTLSDGTQVSPQIALDLLFNAQRKIEADPGRALLEIADLHGARDALVSALVAASNAPQGAPQNSSPRQPAGLSPAQIEERVNAILNDRLSEDAALRAAEAELDRLSKDKPFYADIPEQKMVNFIHMAREDLGETASNEAVFNHAYDMAVYADPALRARAAAASERKPLPAAQTDPKKTADARRAASVNVTSTKAGAPRKLSEDDELSALYDELKAS